MLHRVQGIQTLSLSRTGDLIWQQASHPGSTSQSRDRQAATEGMERPHLMRCTNLLSRRSAGNSSGNFFIKCRRDIGAAAGRKAGGARGQRCPGEV